MKTLGKANKVFFVLALFSTCVMTIQAQSPEETLKERAMEMHETLKSQDENDWENYIKANYSTKMLEKYEMSRHKGMFKRLSKDFPDSQITSIKIEENKVLMAIKRNSDDHEVTFELNYDKDDEYKFNGIGIEAGELR